MISIEDIKRRLGLGSQVEAKNLPIEKEEEYVDELDPQLLPLAVTIVNLIRQQSESVADPLELVPMVLDITEGLSTQQRMMVSHIIREQAVREYMLGSQPDLGLLITNQPKEK